MDKNFVLVRGARQLLTLRGPSGPRRGPALNDVSIIPDGALLIRNGRIQDVGPTRRIENLAAARDAFAINAAGRVVIPSFIDSVTQIVPAEPDSENLSGSRLRNQALMLMQRMARHGTAGVGARSCSGLTRVNALKNLRTQAALDQKPLDVVSTFSGANAVPNAYESDREPYLEKLRIELLPVIGRRHLARFVDIRIGEGAFTTGQARRYLEAARELGFKLKIEAGDGLASAVIALAAEVHAASIGDLGDITPADAASLVNLPTVVILMPGVLYKTHRDPPASGRLLIDNGAALALASGYTPQVSRSYNMQMVISLACRYQGLTPAEAVSASTINGAHANGSADDVGSFEPGKIADLLLLNVSDYHDIPDQVGVNNVHMSVKHGAIIYTEGDVCEPDDRGMRFELLRRA